MFLALFLLSVTYQDGDQPQDFGIEQVFRFNSRRIPINIFHNLSQYVLEEQANNKESVRDFIHQEHQKHNDELQQNQEEGSEFLDLEFSLPNNQNIKY